MFNFVILYARQRLNNTRHDHNPIGKFNRLVQIIVGNYNYFDKDKIIQN